MRPVYPLREAGAGIPRGEGYYSVRRPRREPGGSQPARLATVPGAATTRVGDNFVTVITRSDQGVPHAHGHYVQARLLDMQEVNGSSPVSPTMTLVVGS
jgi:hypothetical protein